MNWDDRIRSGRNAVAEIVGKVHAEFINRVFKPSLEDKVAEAFLL